MVPKEPIRAPKPQVFYDYVKDVEEAFRENHDFPYFWWLNHRFKLALGQEEAVPDKYKICLKYREGLEAIHPEALSWFIGYQLGSGERIQNLNSIIVCKPIGFPRILERQFNRGIATFKHQLSSGIANEKELCRLNRLLNITITEISPELTERYLELKSMIWDWVQQYISRHGIETRYSGFSGSWGWVINDVFARLVYEELLEAQQFVIIQWVTGWGRKYQPEVLNDKFDLLYSEAFKIAIRNEDFTMAWLFESASKLYGLEILEGCLKYDIYRTYWNGEQKRNDHCLLACSVPESQEQVKEAQNILKSLSKKGLEEFTLSYPSWAEASAALLEAPQLVAFSRWLHAGILNPDKVGGETFIYDLEKGRTYQPYEEFVKLDSQLEGYNNKKLKTIMNRWLKGKHWQYRERYYFLQAYWGCNRNDVFKKVEKRNQRAFRAYGILPLESEDEALERYLSFQSWLKEVKQFGMQRQRKERKAINEGLEWLARCAGHPFYMKFEWAMEAKLAKGGGAVQVATDFVLGDYRVFLDFEGSKPVIRFQRGERVLKTTPKVVKDEKKFQQLKAYKKLLNQQRRRFKAGFERCMLERVPFSGAELEMLRENPIARAIVAQLVFRVSDLASSCWRVGGGGLTNLEGMTLPLSKVEEAVILHPVDLEDELLEEARQWAVVQGLVQPFKQLYREIYPLKEEERTASHSLRFTGHELDAGILAAIATQRSYRHKEYEPLTKDWTAAGITAHLLMGEDIKIYGIDDAITREIVFTRLGDSVYPATNWLPLAQVDPIVFSETLRDVDLLVSVNYRNRETRLEGLFYSSPNQVESRASLLQALFKQEPRVAVVKGQAIVEGHLNRYSVDLYTMRVTLFPERNHICIVPANRLTKQERLYLPFEDKDEATVIIVSKIFLLLEDQKIKDEIILNQNNI